MTEESLFCFFRLNMFPKRLTVALFLESAACSCWVCSDTDVFPLSQRPVGVNDALSLSAGREKKLQGHLYTAVIKLKSWRMIQH